MRETDCKFAKFCDCFPYNENINFDDLVQLYTQSLLMEYILLLCYVSLIKH